MKSTTAARLKQIMDDRNLKQVDILNLVKPYSDRFMVKMNKSDLSQYLSGKTTPGQFKLSLLALALNVSEGWLMGLDVPMERATEVPTGWTDGQEELIRLFNQLNDEQKKLVLDLIKNLLAGR